MAFRSLGQQSISRFNSFNSMDLLESMESFLDQKILESSLHKPSQTIAPSSSRCDRHSWFRLRGTEPDVPKRLDRPLDFKAKLGTAIHSIVQQQLKSMLGNNWIDVTTYLQTSSITDRYQINANDDETSLETRIEFLDIPVRFACDGIIRWNDQIYLIEIKTCETSTFKELHDVRSIHVDQIKFYASLLHIQKVLVIYIDRGYGDIKCYEVTLTNEEIQSIRDRIDRIVILSKQNIAPDPLPAGDSMCNSSYCRYYKKCKDWGR